MWDNPRLLNMTAGALTGVALLLLAFAGLQWLLVSTLFPLREVVVLGVPANLARADLERTRERVRGNFFSVRLAEVRAAFEVLPWVRRVQVRRVWPDRLEVTLEEHRALAWWGIDALVNSFGERFSAPLPEPRPPLPLLAGPAGTEALVTERYRRFAQIAAPLGSQPVQVVLSSRFAWQLKLADGTEVVLGRDAGGEQAEVRLARFVEAYPGTLGRIRGEHRYVDLRYPNGFALRVPGVEREEIRKDAAAGRDRAARTGERQYAMTGRETGMATGMQGAR